MDNMGLYSSLAIANSLLDIAEDNGSPLDPMKIQKLIYYAHGWHLAFYDNPLIDEEIQAWQYGPVIHSVYHEFKEFGGQSIDRRAMFFDSVNGTFITPRVDPNDSERTRLLKEIWRVYGKFTGIQLSTMSHTQDSPWFETWTRNTEKLRFVAIPNDSIKSYFKSKLEKQNG